jgi:hypothetical protein
MNYIYCYKHCEKGKTEANKILAESDSVSDAVIDFDYFAAECFNTCPCKEAVLAAISKREK